MRDCLENNARLERKRAKKQGSCSCCRSEEFRTTTKNCSYQFITRKIVDSSARRIPGTFEGILQQENQTLKIRKYFRSSDKAQPDSDNQNLLRPYSLKNSFLDDLKDPNELPVNFETSAMRDRSPDFGIDASPEDNRGGARLQRRVERSPVPEESCDKRCQLLRVNNKRLATKIDDLSSRMEKLEELVQTATVENLSAISSKHTTNRGDRMNSNQKKSRISFIEETKRILQSFQIVAQNSPSKVMVSEGVDPILNKQPENDPNNQRIQPKSRTFNETKILLFKKAKVVNSWRIFDLNKPILNSITIPKPLKNISDTIEYLQRKAADFDNIQTARSITQDSTYETASRILAKHDVSNRLIDDLAIFNFKKIDLPPIKQSSLNQTDSYSFLHPRNTPHNDFSQALPIYHSPSRFLDNSQFQAKKALNELTDANLIFMNQKASHSSKLQDFPLYFKVKPKQVQNHQFAKKNAHKNSVKPYQLVFQRAQQANQASKYRDEVSNYSFAQKSSKPSNTQLKPKRTLIISQSNNILRILSNPPAVSTINVPLPSPMISLPQTPQYSRSWTLDSIDRIVQQLKSKPFYFCSQPQQIISRPFNLKKSAKNVAKSIFDMMLFNKPSESLAKKSHAELITHFNDDYKEPVETKRFILTEISQPMHIWTHLPTEERHQKHQMMMASMNSFSQPKLGKISHVFGLNDHKNYLNVKSSALNKLNEEKPSPIEKVKPIFSMTSYSNIVLNHSFRLQTMNQAIQTELFEQETPPIQSPQIEKASTVYKTMESIKIISQMKKDELEHENEEEEVQDIKQQVEELKQILESQQEQLSAMQDRNRQLLRANIELKKVQTESGMAAKIKSFEEEIEQHKSRITELEATIQSTINELDLANRKLSFLYNQLAEEERSDLLEQLNRIKLDN